MMDKSTISFFEKYVMPPQRKAQSAQCSIVNLLFVFLHRILQVFISRLKMYFRLITIYRGVC